MPWRIIRGMSHIRRIRPLAWVLLVAGIVLLALSVVLDPTPGTPSRLAGIGLLIAGGYLGYSSAHPDVIEVDDELPPLQHDRYAGTTLPNHGDPSGQIGG